MAAVLVTGCVLLGKQHSTVHINSSYRLDDSGAAQRHRAVQSEPAVCRRPLREPETPHDNHRRLHANGLVADTLHEKTGPAGHLLDRYRGCLRIDQFHIDNETRTSDYGRFDPYLVALLQVADKYAVVCRVAGNIVGPLEALNGVAGTESFVFAVHDPLLSKNRVNDV